MKIVLLSAVIGLLTPVYFALGQTWMQIGSPDTNWTSLASSADGNKLAITGGAGYPGHIYISTNSGVTWIKTSSPDRHWTSITSSTDGSTLTAVDWNAGIYTSTNSGMTWISNNAPEVAWQHIAGSSNGTKLVVAGFHPGVIYTSTNSGISWTLSSTARVIWNSLASSADGNKLVAVGSLYVDFDSESVKDILGVICISTNAGATWTKTHAPDGWWNSAASSTDGTILIVGGSVAGTRLGDRVDTDRGLLCISKDSGATWRTNTFFHRWVSVASSTNGVTLAAASYDGIFISTNSGLTWKNVKTSGKYERVFIILSADGNKLTALSSNGSIYTLK